MVNQMFGRGMSSALADNCDLRNIAFASDRGYWNWELVSWCLIRGADIIGTVQRSKWFYFHYNQKKDDRELVTTQGPPNAFYKTLGNYQPGAKSVTGVAFRNGTGSVSLAMSTMMRKAQWDFVLVSPAESRARRQALESDTPLLSLKRQAFCSFVGSKDNSDIDFLLEKINPLTTDQGYNEWHLLRRFSLTSSTTHEAICSAVDFIHPDHCDREAFECVLRFAGKDSLLSTVNTVEEESSKDDSQSAASDTLDDIQLEARSIYEKMLDPTTPGNYFASIEMSASLRKALADIVPGMKVSSSTKDSAIKTKLSSWAAQPVTVRRFCCEKKSVIAARATELGISIGTKTIPELLVEINSKLQASTALESSTEDNNDTQEDKARKSILSTMLKRWFLKPLHGRAKEYCRLGHEAEGLLVSNLAAKFKEHKCLTDINLALHNVYAVGLVNNKDEPCLSDSVDALLICTQVDFPNERIAVPLECKARVTAKTQLEEVQKLEDALYTCDRQPSLNDVYLIRTDNEDDIAFLQRLAGGPKWKELLQVLHHVACYNTNIGALTVGKENGQSFYTVFILFHQGLLNRYTEVIRFLKETALSWAYNTNERPPWDDIKAILDENAKRSIKLEDVVTQFSIWKRLHDPNGDVALPMHRCSRVIPIQHAHWNGLKGVSDTTTKLFDQRELHLSTGSKSPSIEACGRSLVAFTVLVHRMDQVFSAKRAFDTYPTLFHFRNAAVKRRNFSSTLDGIINYLKRTARSMEGPQNDPIPTLLDGNGPRQMYRNKPALIALAAPSTGATPKKNKAKLPEEVIRSNECPGKFILVLEKTKDGKSYSDKRLTCQLCRARTKWYCVLCRRWFCVDTPLGTNDRGKAKQQWASNYWKEDINAAYCREVLSTPYKDATGGTKVMYFKNSCAWFAHKRQDQFLLQGMEERVRNQLEDNNNNSTDAML